MKAIQLMNLAVVAAVLLVSAASGADPECKYRKVRGLSLHWPNPRDCSRYYRCSARGIKREMNCAEGKVYNAKNGKCATNRRGVCKLSLVAPLAGEDNVCAGVVDGAYVSDSGNCRDYYICDGGEAYPESCVAGSMFSAALGVCVVDTEGECWQNACINKPNGQYVGSQSSCVNFYVCNNNNPVQQSCSLGSYFNASAGNCQPDNTEDPKCWENLCLSKNEGAYVPDPSNCNQFYICNDNKPVPQTCPENSYFNPETLNCQPGNCTDIPTTTVSPGGETTACPGGVTTTTACPGVVTTTTACSEVIPTTTTCAPEVPTTTTPCVEVPTTTTPCVEVPTTTTPCVEVPTTTTPCVEVVPTTTTPCVEVVPTTTTTPCVEVVPTTTTPCVEVPTTTTPCVEVPTTTTPCVEVPTTTTPCVEVVPTTTTTPCVEVVPTTTTPCVEVVPTTTTPCVEVVPTTTTTPCVEVPTTTTPCVEVPTTTTPCVEVVPTTTTPCVEVPTTTTPCVEVPTTTTPCVEVPTTTTPCVVVVPTTTTPCPEVIVPTTPCS